MSLTDQDRIEMAADNCEVLRARLAKYEDAEGRPLLPAADLARRIDQAITEFTSGRACMHVPPRDTDVDIVLSECLKLANALESQAREIERLTSQLEHWLSLDKQRDAELAALKAQPSGVVLPEPLRQVIGRADDILHALSGWDSSSVKLEQRHGAGWLKEIDAIRRELHTQLARLNSSPVSAGATVKNCLTVGGVDERAAQCDHQWTDDGLHLLVCTSCGAQEDHDPHWRDMATAPRDGTMVRLLVEFTEHETEDADQAPTIGANNFDNDGEDRWQFAGWCWSHDHFVEGKGEPVGWLPMIEARAALSAPSHGVPEGKEFSQFLSAVMDAAGLVRHGRQSKELSEYLGSKCIQYMTAAPSAGRQKEQE